MGNYSTKNVNNFLFELKNSNIKNNSAEISTLLEQIQIFIQNAFEKIKLYGKDNDILSKLNSNLIEILKELSEKDKKHYNLDYYIKLGLYIQILIENNKSEITDLSSVTSAVIAYLTIAKKTKDSRIKKVALELGMLIDSIKREKDQIIKY